MVNSIICFTTALPFDGAVVGGRESLVFTIQIRIPRQLEVPHKACVYVTVTLRPYTAYIRINIRVVLL